MQKKKVPRQQVVEPVESAAPVHELILPEFDPTVTRAETLPIQQNRPKGLRWVIISSITLGIVAAALGYAAFIKASTKIVTGEGQPSIVEQLGMVLAGNNAPLRGEAEDRINVLLLGIGGDGHAGSELTDSIMVASIKPSTQQVALLSLPRDLQVKYFNEGNTGSYPYEGHKINNAYAWGGSDLTRKKVQDVTGLTIHYYVVVDFSGFRKIIDDVGGVTVTVEQPFTGLYGANELSIPCPPKQKQTEADGVYCAIPFTAGEQHLDGERALIFARIRKLADSSPSGSGSEGSDFARAKRQQLVLEAFKQQLFSSSTLLQPTRFSDVLDDLGAHIKTNLQLWEIVRLVQMTAGLDRDSIITRVIDNNVTTGLVKSEYVNEASVVVPVAGDYDFSAIHALAKTLFDLAPDTIASDSDAASGSAIKSLAVLNGTSVVGLAATIASQLTQADLEVETVGNAVSAATSTTIYDLTNGQASQALAELKTSIPSATVITQSAPTDWQTDYPVDFIVVLGQDASE